MADEKELELTHQQRILELKEASKKAVALEREEIIKKIKELENEKKLLEEAKENRKEKIKDLQDELQFSKNSLEMKQKLLEIAKLELENAKELIDLSEEERKKKEEDYKKAKEAYSEERKKTEELEKQKETLNLITGGLSVQLRELFSIKGVLKNIGENFQAVLKGNAEFAAATGQIADRSLGFGTGLSQYGIGFEKLNKASIDLFKSMSNFSNLNKGLQMNLAESAAKMSNLGVSVETTGKNFDNLTKTLGMSSEQAIQTNDEIAKAAIAAGIAPSKMLGEFATNMPKLAAYGKQAINVYTDLQKQAKSLGIELNILNGIVGDQFDTFEGAAKAAGKLNAVLGGNYLNSVEMLNATESERLVLLKQSFDESGKNFESLGKYEKKAIAATLGITDLNEASKLFNKSTAELTLDMDKQAVSQKKLEEIQAEATEVMDSLKNAFNSFLPLIRTAGTAVKFLADGFAFLNDKLFGIPGLIIAGIFLFGTFSAALLSFAGSMASAITAITSFGTAAPAAAAGVTGATASITTSIISIGAALTGATLGMLAFGASILMIGTGIGLAALGLAMLVKSFSGLGDSAWAAAAGLAVFVISFTAMMVVLLGLVSGPQALLTGAAIGVLLSVGAAALMIGAGMKLAATGISDMVAALSKISADTTNNIISLTTSLSGLVQTLSEIPDEKVVSLQSLNNTINTVKTTKEEDIKPTKDLFNAVKEYYTAQATAKEADKDTLVQALREIMKPKTGEEAGGTKQEKITLVVGVEEIAATIKRQMASTKARDLTTGNGRA